MSKRFTPTGNCGSVEIGRLSGYVGCMRPITAALMIAALFGTAARIDAAVTVSQVGLQSVNLDTRQTGPASSFTAITTQLPRIAEGAAGDISAGATAIVINTPAGGGWAFRVVGVPTATAVSGNIVLGSPVVFPLFINIPVNTPSTVASVIEFGNIEVVPTGCTGVGAHNVRVTTDGGGAGDLNNATLATLTLNAGPNIASYSLSSNSPQAAGSPITVTLTARDGCNNAIANASIPSAITLQADLTGAPLPTWGDGSITLTNKNTVPNQATIANGTVLNASGQGTFTVANSNCAESISLTATEASAIADANTTLTWNNSLSDAGQSLVAVQGVPPNPIADGVDARTIQVTLRDACGNNIAGKLVSLSVQSAGVNAGAITITPVLPTTNASGQATFSVRSSVAQTATFQANDVTDGATVTATADVSFAANRTDSANSTVVASPPSVLADGIEVSTITVTLLNSLNNPVPGHAVSLVGGPASVTVDYAGPGATTDSNGRIEFTAKSTTPQVASLTFADEAPPQVILTPVDVTFINTVDLAATSLSLDPTLVATLNYSIVAPAVGVAPYSIQFYLDDGDGVLDTTLDAAVGPAHAGQTTPGAAVVTQSYAGPGDIPNVAQKLFALVDSTRVIVETNENTSATVHGNNVQELVNPLIEDLVADSIAVTVNTAGGTTSADVTYTVISPAEVDPFRLRVGIDRNIDGVIDSITAEDVLFNQLVTAADLGGTALEPGAHTFAVTGLRAELNDIPSPNRIKHGDRIIATLDLTQAGANEGGVVEDVEVTNNVTGQGQSVDIVVSGVTATVNPTTVDVSIAYNITSPGTVDSFNVRVWADIDGGGDFDAGEVLLAATAVPAAKTTPGNQVLTTADIAGLNVRTAMDALNVPDGTVVYADLDLDVAAPGIVDESDNATNNIVGGNSFSVDIAMGNVAVSATPTTTDVAITYTINSPATVGAFNVRVWADRNAGADFDASEVLLVATVPAAKRAPGTHTLTSADIAGLNVRAALDGLHAFHGLRIFADLDLDAAAPGVVDESEDAANNVASSPLAVDLVVNSGALVITPQAHAVLNYFVDSPASVAPFSIQISYTDILGANQQTTVAGDPTPGNHVLDVDLTSAPPLSGLTVIAILDPESGASPNGNVIEVSDDNDGATIASNNSATALGQSNPPAPPAPQAPDGPPVCTIDPIKLLLFPLFPLCGICSISNLLALAAVPVFFTAMSRSRWRMLRNRKP